MPIKPSVVQRRFAELGRIRLGHKLNGNGRPVKLSHARFTSPQERYIVDLARLYGGDPRPWDNGGKPEFEVFTEAATIPVVVLKGGLSQWLETWSGGGCIHRCDGENDAKTGAPCNPDDPAHKAAKATTRLSVMLSELDAVGSWRLESHGWNAAAELPAIAELAAGVGTMVPASINLVERRSVRDGKTSRYVVPVLDLAIGPARLREVVAASAGLELTSSGAPELAGPGPRAISGGTDTVPERERPADLYAVELDALALATSRETLVAQWESMVARHLVGSSSTPSPEREVFISAWKARAHALPEAASEPATQEPHDGIVDAELVPDETRTADEVWSDDVLPAGNRIGMTLGDLEDGFSSWSSGALSADATADQLAAYARFLNESEVRP